MCVVYNINALLVSESLQLIAIQRSRYIPKTDNDLPKGVTQEDVPILPNYFAGFQSLGSEVSTEKTTEEPAWIQRLGGTTE